MDPGGNKSFLRLWVDVSTDVIVTVDGKDPRPSRVVFRDEESQDQGPHMQSPTTVVIVNRGSEHRHDRISRCFRFSYGGRRSRATAYLFSLGEDTDHISEEGEPMTSRGKCLYQLCHPLSVNIRRFLRET